LREREDIVVISPCLLIPEVSSRAEWYIFISLEIFLHCFIRQTKDNEHKRK
jgi:hypothetical protein